MAHKETGAGRGKRKSKIKDCAHPETGLRYLFTPTMGQKVMAITYCRNCGKELARESVSAEKR
jgi:hypothetical protein